MKLSVIIPVYNEEKVILACLNSLFVQTYQDFEIIVVDDGSTDGTARILSEINKPNLQILRQDHKGPAMARNLGAERANGQILVFVDADMTFDRRFLLELCEPIIKGETKGTASREEFVSNWQNVWGRMWNYNQGKTTDRLQQSSKKEDKVFRAILASEFKRVGGFSEGGYTDDYTLSRKLGYKAKVVAGARHYHANPSTPGQVFSQARWVAKREYKFGKIGAWLVLVRYSLPFTILLGIWGMFKYHEPKYFIFKLVYNTAASIGVLEFNILGRGAK